MKGAGAAAGAGMSTWTDDDPFKDKTKVNCRLSEFSFNRTTFQMKLTVAQTGFTQSAARVNFSIEVNKDENGDSIHWRYWNFRKTVDFTKIGESQTFELYDTIRRTPNLYNTLMHKDEGGNFSLHDNDIYFIFYTQTEICNDQIHPAILR